ncbi:hypothetical protein J3R30DRAFT_3859295, partial [Lentinula aciculospora]
MADHDELLGILQAHGQNFLSSFKAGIGEVSKTNKKTAVHSKVDKEAEEEEWEEEEWEGIKFGSECEGSECEEGITSNITILGFEQNDDDFTAASSSASTPNVLVFSEKSTASKLERDPMAKYHTKTFMSSKISKLREEAAPANSSERTDEDLKEQSNIQNDALLHKLVHTKLLSGSLNSELELTPSQRRKALSGRIVELTGDAKLGRGERLVRTAEHNKASKRVREGLMQKQKERRAAELEEAKNLGNYHPTLKRLLDPDSETAKHKKRLRGLQMGVGSFRGGILKLSREEIDSVQGQRGGITGRGRARGRRG